MTTGLQSLGGGEGKGHKNKLNSMGHSSKKAMKSKDPSTSQNPESRFTSLQLKNEPVNPKHSLMLSRQPVTRHGQGLSWGNRENGKHCSNRKQDQVDPHFTLNLATLASLSTPAKKKDHNKS